MHRTGRPRPGQVRPPGFQPYIYLVLRLPPTRCPPSGGRGPLEWANLGSPGGRSHRSAGRVETMDMTRTFTAQDGSPAPGRSVYRTTWRAHAFVLGGFALAAVYTAAVLGLDAGAEHIGPIWMAAIAWSVVASLAGRPVAGIPLPRLVRLFRLRVAGKRRRGTRMGVASTGPYSWHPRHGGSTAPTTTDHLR